MTRHVTPELADLVDRRRIVRINPALAAVFLRDWLDAGILEEPVPGRFRLSASGAAMFSGWWRGGRRGVSECPPDAVRRDVQRILDAAARRLLAEQLDRNPLAAAAGSDHGLRDNGADQSPPLVDTQHVPVPGADGHGRHRRGL